MGRQILGYRYYLGMHMAICHGPVDAFLRIDVGSKEAWSGNITASSTIAINKPDLFGGDKKEGGVYGSVDLAFGEPTQQKNEYLIRQLDPVTRIIPAFRGITCAIAKQCYVTANSPYPKPWAFLLKRTPMKSWQPALAAIGGSANPIHIIYESITSLEWGMGYPSSSIDETTFALAAAKCFSEGLGLSMSLSAQETIEAFIQLVLSHINGILYTLPDTGQFAVKLLRDDYSLVGMKHFDESNIVKLESFERPSPAEMVNEIIVVYRPQGSASDDSVAVQALAAIQSQSGTISQTRQYPGIDNATNAARVAMRDLRQVSTPLSRISMTVNRSGWDLSVGDVVSFSWLALGITQLVLRVLKVNLGDASSGHIIIDAAEDIFGLPSSTYISPVTNLWVDQPDTATVADSRKVFEATYWDTQTSMSTADLAYLTTTSAFLLAVAAKPSAVNVSYDLYTQSGSTAYKLAASNLFCPTLTVTNDLTKTSTVIPYVSSTGVLSGVEIGGYAYIDSEAVRIDAISEGTQTITIARGCIDTVPETHLANSKIFVVSSNFSFDTTEYLTGETVSAKVRTRTSSNLLSESMAPTDTLVMVGRYSKPYPPGQFKINASYYPEVVNVSIEVTWSHRDRLLQLASIVGTLAGNIGPEPGTTYRVRAYRVSSGALLQSLTGITTTNATLALPSGTYNVRVELESVVGGVVSLQKHTHTFQYANPTATRITEDGNRRVTENLDVRHQE